MKRRTLPVTLSLFLAAAGACGTDGIICTQGIVPAIEVEVRVAATGTPAWWGATGWVQDGTYRDSLLALSASPADSAVPVPLAAAWGRPGTYLVVVRRDGFREWVRDGVTAPETGGQCSTVVTQRLRADLEPN